MARPEAGATGAPGRPVDLCQVEPRQRGHDADQPAGALWRQGRHGRHEGVQEGGRGQRGGVVSKWSVAYCTCMCASYLHARLDPGGASQAFDGGGAHGLPDQLRQLHVVGRFEDLRAPRQASRKARRQASDEKAGWWRTPRTLRKLSRLASEGSSSSGRSPSPSRAAHAALA